MEWRLYAYKSTINIDIVSTSCGLALKSDEICNQVWILGYKSHWIDQRTPICLWINCLTWSTLMSCWIFVLLSLESFQWVLYRWLDESLIEAEAISTTGSVKVWFPRACWVTSNRLGRAVSCPGETLDMEGEERTGTVKRPVKVSKDVSWVVGEWHAKA